MKKIALVLKGYPRLSETFIAQEIRALELRGFNITLVSLRHPTDKTTHPIHQQIEADVLYLPEYLHAEPLRVFKALLKVISRFSVGKVFKLLSKRRRGTVSWNVWLAKVLIYTFKNFFRI